MEIITLTKKMAEQTVALVHARNNHIEHRSMYEYQTKSKIEAEFQENEENIFLAMEDGNLYGCMSCFPDEEQKTVDCSIFVAEDQDFLETAKKMFGYISTEVYGETFHYKFFFPVENEEYTYFLDQIGATKDVNEYCLLLDKGNLNSDEADENVQTKQDQVIQELEEADMEELAQLHSEVFPDVYITGKNIIEGIRQKIMHVYVLKENGVINAYGVLHLHEGERSTAEIIGVRDGYRGRKLGRKILLHVCHQGFEQFGMKQMDLIVDCDNDRALNLYFDLGFKVESENHSYKFNPDNEKNKK